MAEKIKVQFDEDALQYKILDPNGGPDIWITETEPLDICLRVWDMFGEDDFLFVD